MNDIYRKAYARYLRRGTPIDISLKAAEHSTPYYIWHTRGDDKVRTSHAENNGKIFAWDNPPPTGNPGEDYGCRCLAEPYVEGKSEYAYQTLISAVDNSPNKWTDKDFIQHFYRGGGRGLTLSETGHLKGIINYYLYKIYKEDKNSLERVNSQIIDLARKRPTGYFGYYFGDSYDFGSYLYVFGKGTVNGLFSGNVMRQNGIMHIEGTIEYFYDDVFTDILNIREKLRGTSTPEEAYWLERFATDFAGSYFPIIDNWKMRFEAEAKINVESSNYR